MKDFPNILCNLAATAVLLGTSMAATAASMAPPAPASRQA